MLISIINNILANIKVFIYYINFIKSNSKEFDSNKLKYLNLCKDLNTKIKDWRVPPGICAELGYRLAEQGKFEDADALYNLELKF